MKSARRRAELSSACSPPKARPSMPAKFSLLWREPLEFSFWLDLFCGLLCGGGNFSGVGQFAVGFQDLPPEVIRHASFIAGDGKVRGAQELFLAVLKSVANGLLDLRIGKVALSGRFARDELQDCVLVLLCDDRADLSGLQRKHGPLQGGIGFVQRRLRNVTEIAAIGRGAGILG